MNSETNRSQKLQALTKEHRSISLSCFVFILLSQSPQFGSALTTFCVITAGICLLYIDLNVKKKIIEVANLEAHPD